MKSSRNLQDLHPILVAAFLAAKLEYEEKYPDGPDVILTCTFRSNEDQNALYAIGRTTKGKKVTNAKAGESPHNRYLSLAFDVAFLTIQKKLDWDIVHFERFAEIIKRKSTEVVWGGDFVKFKDRPHFELKNWRKYN